MDVMTVAVRDVVAIPGASLRFLAGERFAAQPLRWVHSSELEDPTPWLQGGELILTTGLRLGATPAAQRAYVRRLVDAGVAGLGFGVGFGHARTPRALVTEAEKLGFPVFEIPTTCRSSRSPRRCSRGCWPSSTTPCSAPSTPNTR